MSGAKSQLSIDLSNVKRDITCGHTQAKVPKHFTDAEMEQLYIKRDTLQAQQFEVQEARRAARVNDHTTSEVNRNIEATKIAVHEGTRNAENFFAAIGGAGSSQDLRLQARVLMARAKEMQQEGQAPKMRQLHSLPRQMTCPPHPPTKLPQSLHLLL